MQFDPGNINKIQQRIQQIESKFTTEAPKMPEISFQSTMEKYAVKGKVDDMPANQPKMNYYPGTAYYNPIMQETAKSSNEPINVRPLAQSNSISCGQTSVAMAINAVTGKSLTDREIDARYGFSLLGALNAETSYNGISWQDGGNVSSNSWNLIDRKVNVERTPVVVALNGPEFSPTGRGHIVTIVKTEGNTVYFADPASGKIRTTTKDRMNQAPSHPDGNFIFFASKVAG